MTDHEYSANCDCDICVRIYLQSRVYDSCLPEAERQQAYDLLARLAILDDWLSRDDRN
jgi:hypothetical protein